MAMNILLTILLNMEYLKFKCYNIIEDKMGLNRGRNNEDSLV